MQRPSEDHRSVAFPQLVLPLLRDTARLMGTERGRVALFTASGTGGWEAALTNTVPAGSRLLLPCAGHFADLWGDSATRLGYGVERLDGVAWGDAPPADRIGERLASDTAHQIAAVLIVHNETSTGVTADLPAIRDAMNGAGHPALLMSDGVSAIASLPYHHDQWGVDVALTGSQKGLMMPAGIAITAWSPRALERVASNTAPRAYFDLRPMLAQNAEGYFPYTPSIPLLYGLRESLAVLFEEGLDTVWARHRRLAAGVRAAVGAWQLGVCCRDDRFASNTVTTVMLPPGIDGRALLAHAFTRYDLALGGGLGPLGGKAFRIGHLGDLNEGMLLGAIALVEMTLRDVGVPVRPGSGVAAAEDVWAATS